MWKAQHCRFKPIMKNIEYCNRLSIFMWVKIATILYAFTRWCFTDNGKGRLVFKNRTAKELEKYVILRMKGHYHSWFSKSINNGRERGDFKVVQAMHQNPSILPPPHRPWGVHSQRYALRQNLRPPLLFAHDYKTKKIYSFLYNAYKLAIGSQGRVWQ